MCDSGLHGIVLEFLDPLGKVLLGNLWCLTESSRVYRTSPGMSATCPAHDMAIYMNGAKKAVMSCDSCLLKFLC